MIKLFWYGFALNHVRIPYSCLSKVSKLFPCNSNSFLNFRVSSARLLIKLFLILKKCETNTKSRGGIVDGIFNSKRQLKAVHNKIVVS